MLHYSLDTLPPELQSTAIYSRLKYNSGVTGFEDNAVINGRKLCSNVVFDSLTSTLSRHGNPSKKTFDDNCYVWINHVLFRIIHGHQALKI